MNDDGTLPTGVYRSSTPPEVWDEVAADQLGTLICRAVRELSELSQLGHRPIAIAASPNRFDDAWNYEWLAVRCGSFFSEEGSYMGQHNLTRDIRSAPSEAKAAYEVLLDLEASGWRELFGTAFGVKWSDQSLSLVIQDGATWLVFSSNNFSCGEGDPVFTVSVFGEITYFGEAEERFDWAIQDQVPLVFRLSSRPESGAEA